jgi:hypothetical protein
LQCAVGESAIPRVIAYHARNESYLMIVHASVAVRCNYFHFFFLGETDKLS